MVFFLNLVPVSIYITAELGLGWPSVFLILAGASVVLLYGLLVRFFVSELALRPVVEAISVDLPDEEVMDASSVSLRKKLLVALPAINIITGVAVSGLATRGHASLSDLGVNVLIAVVVAFTISLELTLLLTRSLLAPINALRRATEQVKRRRPEHARAGHRHRRDGRARQLVQPDGRRASPSARSCTRRSAPTSTPGSPSESCARAPRSPARRSR